MTKTKQASDTKTVVTIASRRDGFRRCGVAHPEAETTYDPQDKDFPFSENDLEILMAEPMLVVTVREVPIEIDAAAK